MKSIPSNYRKVSGSGRFGDYWDYWTETPTTWNQIRNQAILGGLVAPIGAYYRVRDYELKYNDYYKNQPYANFPRYPALLDYSGAYSSFASSTLSFVSSNIKRLYT